MSDEIDPELLARSRRKFAGMMGAKAEKKEEEKAAVKAKADDVDDLIDAELAAALDWAKRASKG